MEGLRKKRSGFAGTITRIVNRFQRTLDDDPNSLDLTLLERQLETIHSSDESFRSIHSDICDLHTTDSELEAEYLTLDKHEEAVANAVSLIKRLIAIRSLHSAVFNLRHEIEILETKISEHPDKSFDTIVTQVRENFKQTQDDLRRSTIPSGHEIRGLVHELVPRVIDLASTNRTSPMDVSTTSVSSTSQIKLPKLSLPSFHGDPMKWSIFWEQFSSAVHNNNQLDNAQKLTYLREAITDPKVSPLLFRATATSGQYDELVTLLKERYDQKRLIHRTHAMSIIDAPTLKQGNHDELCLFVDNLKHNISSLKDSGHYSIETFLTSVLFGKLNKRLQESWLKYSRGVKGVPDITLLIKFLEEQLSFTPITFSPPIKSDLKVDASKRNKAPVYQVVSQRDSKVSCQLCRGDKHPMYFCPTYKAMSLDKRNTYVKNNNLCSNCLYAGHKTKDCRCSGRCHRCGKLHHTTLHKDSESSSVQFTVERARDSASSNTDSTKESTTSASNTTSLVSESTTLNTATTVQLVVPTLQMTSQVILESPDGRKLQARALLDPGASISLVTKRIVQNLQLKKDPYKLTITGAQGVSTGESSYSATFKIRSIQHSRPTLSLTAAVVPKVTCDLPLQGATRVRNLDHLKNLSLADPSFDLPGRIDLLIGCNLLQDVLTSEIRRGNPNQPMAMNTVFGWAILGRYTLESQPQSSQSVHICNAADQLNHDTLLKRFWEIEETSTSSQHLSPEEKEVITHFKTNHVLLPAGRYEVTLPKISDAPPLGESRFQAVSRYLANERSILRKGTYEKFQGVVQEYLDLRHTELVPSTEIDHPVSKTYYLPMHAVMKESSTTTKLRVVFDASARTTTGHCLNDTLTVGPTLYPDIIDVLIRFRSYPVAITADISKMYRAVGLASADRDLHRFVWRSNLDSEIHDYRMTRVTFGVAASAFAAVQALQQTATDFESVYPLASKHVFSSFYVDDCLAGAESPQDAIELHHQLRSLLHKGGFDLRKWRSSSVEVMESIPTDLHESTATKDLVDINSDSPKALGVHWDSSHDVLHVSIGTLSSVQLCTKRNVISDIAKTFDVFGWFAPSTILMKILFQHLWEIKVEWDEAVPEDIHEKYQEWKSQLPVLKTVTINRCYVQPGNTVIKTELHGFSDASVSAYAAVVYIRVVYSNRPPSLALVIAKTKVAPLKQISIPRLELSGAQLLAKLLDKVRTALNIDIQNTYAWSDSTIVLYWLDGNPKRFKTFVGNRISKILELLPTRCWRHVPTDSNPADCASRGLMPKELLLHSLWWEGPQWLQLEPPEFPPQPLTSPTIANTELKTACLITSSSSSDNLLWIEDKYSSYSKLVGILAWIFRFIQNIKARKAGTPITTSALSVDELRKAETFLYTSSQIRSFEDERRRLLSKASLKSSSTLLCLNPTIGSDGLIRVGGRLKNSSLSYSQRHPIILHGKDALTILLVHCKHISLLHSGPTLLLATLSNSLHIIGARRLVRTVCRSCVTCRKVSAKTECHMMRQLPAPRVLPNSAFSITGVDFAGPFTIKKGHTRKPVLIKAYICIFVCMSTKATHLEIVSDLTTEAFIATLKRFISRRGLPKELYSDNGKNFAGASNDLKSLYSFLSKSDTQNSISNFVSSQRISWHFSPERAPHFGGLWEAGVKSMKYHLKRVVGQQQLTFEELNTLVCQIEACLNSRPLVPLTSHAEDGIEVLTPGHFIIGKSLQALPSTDNTSEQLHLLKRWSLCQALSQHWWQRWSHEYLQQLQRRVKWKTPSRNLQPGDIVLVKEETLVSPTHWPVARIVSTYPGKDGHTRVVTVKTSSGVYKRPVNKLVLLVPQ